MRWLSTVDRYLVRRTISGLLLAFVIVASIIVLVDFVEGTRNYGSEPDITNMDIFILTILKAPRLLEQTIPFVVLFGIMGTLYNLNRRSELIVLRASGLSAWRFLTPVIFVTAGLGLLWTLIFNPLASQAMHAHDSFVEHINVNQSAGQEAETIWLREGSETGQILIKGELLNSQGYRIRHATFWLFKYTADGNIAFDTRLDSQLAQWTEGYWQLSDVVENTTRAGTQNLNFLSLPTTLTREDILNASERRTAPPFWRLPAEIKRMELAGFSAKVLSLQYHRLLSLPLTLIAMTLIAAGVSMHLTREGGTLQLMLFGGTVGFIVFFVDNVISAFGEVGALPIILAAWAMPVFALFCGISYLTRLEDG